MPNIPLTPIAQLTTALDSDSDSDKQAAEAAFAELQSFAESPAFKSDQLRAGASPSAEFEMDRAVAALCESGARRFNVPRPEAATRDWRSAFKWFLENIVPLLGTWFKPPAA